MLTQDELVKFLADTLRQTRRVKGYTLDKLSDRSETDYSTVSLIENGKQQPRVHTIYKLLYALDIDIVSLLSNETNKLQDKKVAIFNRLDKLDMETLESIDEILNKFIIKKK